MTTGGDRIIGTVEAAELLGLNLRTAQRRVIKAVETGQIEVIRKGEGRGNAYLFHESDLPKIANA